MNYKLVITDEYKKRLKKFLKKHPDMFERYAKCIFILENDPFHPSLRLHKLKGKLADFHSISINMETGWAGLCDWSVQWAWLAYYGGESENVWV